MNLKTVIGLVVSGFLVPIMAKKGLPALTADEQATLIGALVAGAGIAVHTISPTKILAWLAKAKEPTSTITSVSPEVVQAIAVATVREFRKPVQEKTT